MKHLQSKDLNNAYMRKLLKCNWTTKTNHKMCKNRKQDKQSKFGNSMMNQNEGSYTENRHSTLKSCT